jgi:hypothetical protein
MIARHRFQSAGFPQAGYETGNRVFVDSFALKSGLGAEATLTRVGPTTPKHRARELRASVDQTEARNSRYNAVEKRFRIGEKT